VISAGLVGYDGNGSQDIVDAYWDTTTSGINESQSGAQGTSPTIRG